MKVNSSKTAMLCISGAQSYKANAYIYDAAGEKIESGESMKFLGFHFSRRPGVHAHVEALRKRFRRQYWVLFHLRRSGFREKELARVYRTILLPMADYCAAVYHPMLNDEQDQVVERLQAQALRCIYGPFMSYAMMREKAEVSTLRQRRIEICDKFASKCINSSRFSHWFPLRTSGRSGNRGGD